MTLAAYHGLSYSDYCQMDAEEFASWIKGRSDKEESELAYLRWMTAALMNVHVKKKIEPTKLFKLKSEKGKTVGSKVPTKEEREEMKKVWQKWDEKRKNG